MRAIEIVQATGKNSRLTVTPTRVTLNTIILGSNRQSKETGAFDYFKYDLEGTLLDSYVVPTTE